MLNVKTKFLSEPSQPHLLATGSVVVDVFCEFLEGNLTYKQIPSPVLSSPGGVLIAEIK